MLGLHRVREATLLAVDLDVALVGLVDAGQDLHQRRLARAVLTDQAVHLAGVQGQVRVGEHGVAEEALA